MNKIGRLNIESTLFMVCDIQSVFRPLIYNFDHMLKTSQTAVSAAEALDIPVVVTEQNPNRLGTTCEELKVNELKNTKVFSKQLFSMATPEVMDHLKSLNRKSVVLFGLETHVCVFQTSLDLLNMGYEVHLLVDGVSSQRQFDRATALSRLQNAGCFLTSVESVLFALIKTADNPKFKTISKLAKEYGQQVKSVKHLSTL
eukprot:maker-scaffold_18-snap-gene-6.1-mRNA-1 protein AED:0.03 eAED:0.03 QI:95/1/1/1/0.5/0.33/3/24/199